MERYQWVEKEDVPIRENEIRITYQGLTRNYISYSYSLLQETQVTEIVLKAMGQVISKTVAIAEIIKKRRPRLHQDTAISSVSIKDVWEPIEEGLVPVENPTCVYDINHFVLSIGYQAPLHRPSASVSLSAADKHVLCIIMSMKILMAEEGVEGEGEGEAGVGEDMEIIKGETIRAETTNVVIIMVEINLGEGIIKADAIIKVDTIKIMVDTQIMDWGGRGRGWGYRGSGYESGGGGCSGNQPK